MTRREHIIEALAVRPHKPSELAEMFETTTKEIIEDLDHIAKTLKQKGKKLVVKQPECNKCGFRFKQNFPSKCPECDSEDIDEAAFAILN